MTQDFAQIREQLLAVTKEQIARAVTPDTLIMQALATLDELTIQLNMLATRLREWHAYTLPELEYAVADHERYARLIAGKSHPDLLREFASKQSMGALLTQDDYAPVQSLAVHIVSLYDYKATLMTYIEQLLATHAKNVHALAGTTIAARLLASAGSLRRLAMMPSSTIQLLGAEKALFRHLRSGAKSPKHGHIYSHPIMQRSSRKDAGKIARALADKIALCAKLDFFKGEFKADEYRKDIETRFGSDT